MSMPSSSEEVATRQGSRPDLSSSSTLVRSSWASEPWWARAISGAGRSPSGSAAACCSRDHLVQALREPLRAAAVVDEDDRRGVLADQLEQLRVDRGPDRAVVRLAGELRVDAVGGRASCSAIGRRRRRSRRRDRSCPRPGPRSRGRAPCARRRRRSRTPGLGRRGTARFARAASGSRRARSAAAADAAATRATRPPSRAVRRARGAARDGRAARASAPGGSRAWSAPRRGSRRRSPPRPRRGSRAPARSASGTATRAS